MWKWGWLVALWLRYGGGVERDSESGEKTVRESCRESAKCYNVISGFET